MKLFKADLTFMLDYNVYNNFAANSLPPPPPQHPMNLDRIRTIGFYFNKTFGHCNIFHAQADIKYAKIVNIFVSVVQYL